MDVCLGGGAGASRIVGLLRSAEVSLRKEAEASGMLSTEKWPCLVQPPPGVVPGEAGGEDATALHNLYLRPLPLLIEAKLKLAVALQLTSSAPSGMAAAAATDAAGVLLSEAKTLCERTLHPRPSLVAKVLHNLQVRVTNLHMRYEDATNCPDSPFAFPLKKRAGESQARPRQAVAGPGALFWRGGVDDNLIRS